MTAAPLPTVLLAFDDTGLVDRARGALSDAFDCLIATDAAEALSLLGEHFVQVVLCDAGLRLRGGAPLLSEIRARWPETARLRLQRPDAAPAPSHDDAHDDARQDGAACGGLDHLLHLPCPDDQLRSEVATAARLFQLARENQRLTLEARCRARTARPAAASVPTGDGGFAGILRQPRSPMEPVVEAARQIASFDIPVLLQGEPSTGKRLLARAMHDMSLRSDKPFLSLDCAGLDPETLALELFGARNGSVPNGQRTRLGLLQRADRGTLYLGGLDGLPPALQLALLRFLQDGTMLPVGGHEPVKVWPRLILGCSGDLARLSREGRFCRDLFYMLAAARLDLPPLRDRPQDIAPIANAMLHEAAAAHGKPVFGLERDTVAFLRNYGWPGNLRELQAEIIRMLIFAQADTLGPDLLSRHILQHGPARADEPEMDAVMCSDRPLKERIDAIEGRILRETLTRLKWNKSRAAQELGLSRVGLRAKLDRYGIARPAPQPQET